MIIIFYVLDVELSGPLQYLNNPILDLQKISKEFCDTNRNDTSRRVVIDKLNPKVKKGELVTIVAPYGGREKVYYQK